MYGVQPNSRYWPELRLEAGQVALSRGLQEKFGISAGDTLQLNDKCKGEGSQFTANSEYGSESTMALYLPLSDFDKIVRKRC